MGQYTVVLHKKQKSDRKDPDGLPTIYYQGNSPHLGKISAFFCVVKDQKSTHFGEEIIMLEIAKGRRLLKDRVQIRLVEK